MAKEIRPVTTGTAVPVHDVEPDWDMPSVVTPVRSNLAVWEWSSQLRPPSANDFQDKYAKAVLPIRAVALFLLWITWHWTRVAGAAVLVSLVLVLVRVT